MIQQTHAGSLDKRNPRRERATTSGAGEKRTNRVNTAHSTHGGERKEGRRKELPRGKARGMRRADRGRRPPAPIARTRKASARIPALGEGNIRIIPLGGVEEIGKNMTAIQFGEDIIVVDAGFQFREEDTPGIDYILPNTKYLEERKANVRALVVTHGHLDHIGAIPYLMEKLGNPPIYSRNLTTIMIKKRQEEFPHMPELNIQVVEKSDRVKLGNLSVSFFAVTHTIPDAMGVIIKTPYGNIVHTGDLKLDHTNGIPTDAEEEEFSIFTKEPTLLLMADSTNVERPGFSIPERKVHENLDEIIKSVRGRIIIGTFASQLERIIKIIEFGEKNGKKIVVEGRSMKNNIEVAKATGYLKMAQQTVIPAEQIGSYPPSKIMILATGAQGEEYAALMRIANKQHKTIQFRKDDTVLLSSSIIPGNERSIQKLKDNISRHGTKIIHYQVSDVHSSGHAYHDETLWIHKKIAPKFFIPIHGYHYMLRVHTEIAKEAGTLAEHIIIPDNGSVIEITDKGTKIILRKETAPSNPIMVDGFSVGDVQEVVLRDRQMLSQDGMFVVIATIDVKTGKLKKSPDIISRGFVYLKESQELLARARDIVKKSVEQTTAGMHPINFDYVKNNITDATSRYLFQKAGKRPIVIPVVLGV
ncbi:MAG: ribonuclease J [Candidatus Lloydbacteria bacterium CG22_combo_CG10-13_8_21_14_all_47_15]|uniref:Ribonuclease J n=1 Tax=Candidatus Lloydbacteria bacterium CG22_combo_CG10-13_8_21_14_all_47_15 TaxID=1974635 RepID=A0A2H0CTN7_9BACT|nr:MAG: ribonuclease J [Candidatus Lloydbacteria bacterium CG22_combo_CG10-13_8_21_14_all_47_15]